MRASDLSRGALWQAMRERNCYATTSARVLLDMRIGDLSMGQEGRVGRGDPLRSRRQVRVSALKSRPGIMQVVLVRNSEEIDRATWQPEKPEVVFEDEAPLDDVALRETRFHPEPFVVYYVRLSDPYHQTQWSSPIWLDL